MPKFKSILTGLALSTALSGGLVAMSAATSTAEASVVPAFQTSVGFTTGGCGWGWGRRWGGWGHRGWGCGWRRHHHRRLVIINTNNVGAGGGGGGGGGAARNFNDNDNERGRRGGLEEAAR
ncbi:hypothetical protein [Streptosporangium sp. NPDC000239]|uniref:hypothetical protein n=1 Tax=unclassified Streptosporangium TaxID=2632669 RepID=UPI00331C9EA6